MHIERFWNLIGAATDESAEIVKIPARLVEMMSQEPVEQIVAYDLIYTAYMDYAYDMRLWAAAFVICGGCSDDGFVAFRGWLIAHGKGIYNDAIEDPDTLSEIYDPEVDRTEAQLEPMNSVAFKCYQRKTGRSDFELLIPPWTPPKARNENVWRGEQNKEVLARIVPKLVNKFM